MSLHCRDCRHQVRYIGQRVDGSAFYIHVDWREGYSCACFCHMVWES